MPLSLTSNSAVKMNLYGGFKGASGATDNAVPRFNGTTGNVIQNSSATISDDGTLSINPTDGTTSQGLVIDQTSTTFDTGSDEFFFNEIQILSEKNTVDTGSIATIGFRTYMQSTGGDGTKTGIQGLAQHAVDSTPAQPGDIIGGDFLARSDANYGGTNTAGGAQGTLYGLSGRGLAAPGATNYAVVSGGEVSATVQSGATCKHRWGWSIVALGAVGGAASDAALEIGAVTGNQQWGAAIHINSIHGIFAVSTSGAIIATDGVSATVAHGIDLSALTITGNFLKGPSGSFTVTGAGATTATTLARTAPVTETNSTHTLAATTTHLICNRAGTVTVTLPAASSFPGREIYVKTIQAQQVDSASSNVVPSTSASAGTAIVPGTDGAWALLVSDGTNWVIMAASPLV